MGDLFSYDGKLMFCLRKITDMVLVSLLWAVCCLPVFTIGASTSALYYTLHKNLRQERGHVCGVFFRGFKTSFKQATVIWLVLLAIALLFAGDIAILKYFSDTVASLGQFTVLFYLFLLLELMYCIYVFPYISRFSAAARTVVKNCFVLMIRHMAFSLLELIIVLFGALLVWLQPILVFLIPALVAWPVNYFMEKTYRLYMPKDEK